MNPLEEAAMTNKELRKAKRDELIEMLYYLRKEADDLKAENDMLRAKILLLSGEQPAVKDEPNAEVQ